MSLSKWLKGKASAPAEASEVDLQEASDAVAEAVDCNEAGDDAPSSEDNEHPMR